MAYTARDLENTRQWRAANRERALEHSRKSMRDYYYKMKAIRHAEKKAYYAANPDKDRRAK